VVDPLQQNTTYTPIDAVAMKILESQNALLSNYEVYQHLVDQKKRNKAQKRKPPVNYITITNDVCPPL